MPQMSTPRLKMRVFPRASLAVNRPKAENMDSKIKNKGINVPNAIVFFNQIIQDEDIQMMSSKFA